MSLMLNSTGGLEMLKRALYGGGGTITNATNASPSVITFSPGPPPAGALITITGVGGNTAVNTTGIVYNTTSTTASLETVNASSGAVTAVNGNGAYTSGGTWSLASLENFYVKLYTNNVTPAESDVVGTYTEMTNASGYSRPGQTVQSLVGAPSGVFWNAPATVGSGGTGGWAATGGGSFSASTNVPESTINTALVWNFTGTQSTYGYFVVGITSGIAIWAERFSNPPLNFSSGSQLSLTNRFGMTHS